MKMSPLLISFFHSLFLLFFFFLSSILYSLSSPLLSLALSAFQGRPVPSGVYEQASGGPEHAGSPAGAAALQQRHQPQRAAGSTPPPAPALPLALALPAAQPLAPPHATTA